MVSLGESDEVLEKKLLKHNWDLKIVDWKLESEEDGKTSQFYKGCILIRTSSVPSNAEAYSVLQHEIFHSVQFFMETLKIPLTEHTCEPYAYLIGYITKEIYKHLLV